MCIFLSRYNGNKYKVNIECFLFRPLYVLLYIFLKKPFVYYYFTSSFTNEEDTMALVKCWAEKYLDSGVSVQSEMDAMSGIDYDSDDSHHSVQTVHHSYSCIPSELEVSFHTTWMYVCRFFFFFFFSSLPPVKHMSHRCQRWSLKLWDL